MDDGEEIPQMKSIQQHINGEFSEDYAGGIWGYVDVGLGDIPEDVMARVNITVPLQVLAKIDRRVKREGETRSVFLVKATLEHISTKA